MAVLGGRDGVRQRLWDPALTVRPVQLAVASSLLAVLILPEIAHVCEGHPADHGHALTPATSCVPCQLASVALTLTGPIAGVEVGSRSPCCRLILSAEQPALGSDTLVRYAAPRGPPVGFVDDSLTAHRKR